MTQSADSPTVQSMQPFSPAKLPLQQIDWEGLIPPLGRANRALAKYDGLLHGLPNPDVLLSPLTTQEAVLSSRIEGTQATLGEVLKYEAGEEPQQESKRLDIQEIINYRRALRAAEIELRTRPFNLNLCLTCIACCWIAYGGETKRGGSSAESRTGSGQIKAQLKLRTSFHPLRKVFPNTSTTGKSITILIVPILWYNSLLCMRNLKFSILSWTEMAGSGG